MTDTPIAHGSVDSPAGHRSSRFTELTRGQASVVVVGLCHLLLTTPLCAQAQARWWAGTMRFAAAAEIPPAGYVFPAIVGWVCSVDPIPASGVVGEGRMTTCRKGPETIAFSVQCGRERPEDRLQIKLRDSRTGQEDFVEVSCRFGR